MEISEAHATLAGQKLQLHSLGMRQLAQVPFTIRPGANKMCKSPEPKISPELSETHGSNLPSQPL